MAKRYERYYKVAENQNGDENTICVALSYNLGGYNYFTYKNEPRGFYLSVQPENRSNGMVSFVGFSGVKKFLKEVKRYSVKSYDEAKSMIDTEMETFVKPWCKANGYRIVPDYTERER